MGGASDVVLAAEVRVVLVPAPVLVGPVVVVVSVSSSSPSLISRQIRNFDAEVVVALAVAGLVEEAVDSVVVASSSPSLISRQILNLEAEEVELADEVVEVAVFLSVVLVFSDVVSSSSFVLVDL